MTYDHWAAASAALRQKLLIPMNESVGTTTVVKIEADGNKTVITMGGGVHSDTNTNFRFIQECLDWVVSQTVSVLTAWMARKKHRYYRDMHPNPNSLANLLCISLQCKY